MTHINRTYVPTVTSRRTIDTHKRDRHNDMKCTQNHHSHIELGSSLQLSQYSSTRLWQSTWFFLLGWPAGSRLAKCATVRARWNYSTTVPLYASTVCHMVVYVSYGIPFFPITTRTLSDDTLFVVVARIRPVCAIDRKSERERETQTRERESQTHLPLDTVGYRWISERECCLVTTTLVAPMPISNRVSWLLKESCPPLLLL